MYKNRFLVYVFLSLFSYLSTCKIICMNLYTTRKVQRDELFSPLSLYINSKMLQWAKSYVNCDTLVFATKVHLMQLWSTGAPRDCAREGVARRGVLL